MEQSLFEVSAGLASLRGESTRAARFYGAAESLTAQTGIRRDAADEAFLAPHIAKARRALGESAFDADEVSGIHILVMVIIVLSCVPIAIELYRERRKAAKQRT